MGLDRAASRLSRSPGESPGPRHLDALVREPETKTAVPSGRRPESTRAKVRSSAKAPRVWDSWSPGVAWGQSSSVLSAPLVV